MNNPAISQAGRSPSEVAVAPETAAQMVSDEQRSEGQVEVVREPVASEQDRATPRHSEPGGPRCRGHSANHDDGAQDEAERRNEPIRGSVVGPLNCCGHHLPHEQFCKGKAGNQANEHEAGSGDEVNGVLFVVPYEPTHVIGLRLGYQHAVSIWRASRSSDFGH